ncbi:MAG TPA: cytochrome C oxidase subunit IV family protein [Cyclobacteriaceae bacterium]|jgi:cytochrome c oxidase subunit IV
MEETKEIIVQPVNKEKVRQLVRVAIILGIVTGLEFLVAFTFHSGPLKTSIFVAMTIIKAFYIVGEFMHLRHEVKMLIWSILLPMMFVVWLLITLIYEGGSILQVR